MSRLVQQVRACITRSQKRQYSLAGLRQLPFSFLAPSPSSPFFLRLKSPMQAEAHTRGRCGETSSVTMSRQMERGARPAREGRWAEDVEEERCRPAMYRRPVQLRPASAHVSMLTVHYLAPWR